MYAGNLNHATNCANCACVQDVRVSKLHHSNLATVKLEAVMAGTVSDEMWAFDKLKMQTDGTPI